MENIGIQLLKVKSYADRIRHMLNNNSEKLFKRYPGGGDGQYVDGYRGRGEEEHAFLCWLIDDVVDILETVNADVNDRIEEELQARASNRRALWISASTRTCEAGSPVRISDLCLQLQAIAKIHGDLIILLEGNPLATLSPIIWTGKDHTLAGEVLENCLFLEAATEGSAS